MLDISIRANIAEASRALGLIERRQLPYATALTVTGLARRVRDAETKALPTVFDNPTPFTMGAFGVIPARKANLAATVFTKDIAARYLAPFEFGGSHFLGAKRALLEPVNQPVNVYGNLPRATLKRLKGRRDVFIGPVKTRGGGTINGVWQRMPRGASGGALKLLIRFADSKPVTQHLDFRKRADAVVRRWFQAEYAAAFRKALATAR